MGRHRAPEEDFIPGLNGSAQAALVYCQPFWKRYKKFIVAALGAFVSTMLAVYTGGITPEEWYLIITAVASALGVSIFPNASNEKVVKNDDSIEMH